MEKCKLFKGKFKVGDNVIVTIKAIYLGNFKLEFHKIRKDYLIHLQNKSICKRSSFTKMPKIGIISADLDKTTNIISLFQRVAKNASHKDGFKLLSEFKPTEVNYDRTTHSRIYYKTQKFLHKDILLTKSEVEIFFENGVSKCTGQELVDYLWESKELSNFTPNKVKAKSYLNIPDDKLTGDEIRLKMEEEISVGICPF